MKYGATRYQRNWKAAVIFSNMAIQVVIVLLFCRLAWVPSFIET
jgi:hypothetical protein